MVYIFDHAAQEWIIEAIAPDAPLPGTKRGFLRYGDFLGPSTTDMAWSDTRALNALELLTLYAAPEKLQYGFRRLEEHAHTGDSAHYAGLAFHLGRRLNEREQMHLIHLALDVCGFDKVEPPYLTPGCVHVEKTVALPANLRGGYPALTLGQKGVHVMVMQDALRYHGFLSQGLSGCFTESTAKDVRRFQHARELTATGAVDSATWDALMRRTESWQAGE